MKKFLFVLVLVSTIFFACSQNAKLEPKEWVIGDFYYIDDEDGQEVKGPFIFGVAKDGIIFSIDENKTKLFKWGEEFESEGIMVKYSIKSCSDTVFTMLATTSAGSSITMTIRKTNNKFYFHNGLTTEFEVIKE